jgi:putative lipoic acid-binding regulatory protein
MDLFYSPESRHPSNQLYVRLRLETTERVHLITSEDVAQAAKTAFLARAKAQRCRVYGLSIQPSQIESIIQFPASMPLNLLGRMLSEISEDAIVRALHLAGKGTQKIWSRSIRMETLNAQDVDCAVARLHSFPQETALD